MIDKEIKREELYLELEELKIKLRKHKKEVENYTWQIGIKKDNIRDELLKQSGLSLGEKVEKNGLKFQIAGAEINNRVCYLVINQIFNKKYINNPDDGFGTKILTPLDYFDGLF